jgi:hypothetical protein
MNQCITDPRALIIVINLCKLCSATSYYGMRMRISQQVNVVINYMHSAVLDILWLVCADPLPGGSFLRFCICHRPNCTDIGSICFTFIVISTIKDGFHI